MKKAELETLVQELRTALGWLLNEPNVEHGTHTAITYAQSILDKMATTQTEIGMKVFTLMGYTVTNADQARSILVVATLKGNKPVAEQCRSVIKQFEA